MNHVMRNLNVSQNLKRDTGETHTKGEIMFRKSTFLKLSVVACTTVFSLISANAWAMEEQLKKIDAYAKGELSEWASHPLVIEAVRKQNEEHASLSFEHVVSLDNTWRDAKSEEENKALAARLHNKAAAFLKGLQVASHLGITEVFVVDNRGLNVAQSTPTSDFWQGDEDKWLYPYYHDAEVDKGTPYDISDIDYDSSTGAIQVQASLPIKDPDTGDTIGTITFGFNLGKLAS